MPELLTIDGVDMRTGVMGVSTRTGRYDLPELRGENLELPGRSGYIFNPYKPFGPGTGALQCWAIGATAGAGESFTVPATYALRRAALETNLATIQRLFMRAHKLSTIRAAQPDGVAIRRAFVEFTEMGNVDLQAGGTRAEFTVAYDIPAVFWEDEAATTQAATAGATLPKTLDLTSFAGMTGFIEDAVFTVSGQITNPRITDSETGAYIEYTGTVVNGQSWVVDSANFTSKVNGASVMAATKHVGGYRLLVIPNVYVASNTPRLVLSGSAGGTNTNLSVTARRKWVSG